ncbi:MAG: hypothetical protein R3Y32_03090 [Bacillota bacterium]
MFRVTVEFKMQKELDDSLYEESNQTLETRISQEYAIALLNPEEHSADYAMAVNFIGECCHYLSKISGFDGFIDLDITEVHGETKICNDSEED